MKDSTAPLSAPRVDPTPIFEFFRGSYGSELLTAAVAHFDLFGKLAAGHRSATELQQALALADRPWVVLTTALRAMGLLYFDAGDVSLTPLAREHLVPGGTFDVSDYVGLAASAPGVLQMVKRLRTNQPAGLEQHESGAAFIYRAGLPSAMEERELADHFTKSLAGRARNVAPVLAERVPLTFEGDGPRVLLDVGGGSGIYSVAYLRREPELRAIVFDRPEVLRVAAELAATHGVADRLEFCQGDMFVDRLPKADVVLLSNVLHDWDVPACQQLVKRCTRALNPGGRLIVHDVLLNDDLDGPLPIALYSAALFSLTEGRAYSAREYHSWLTDAGLVAQPPLPTLIHCHAIVAS